MQELAKPAWADPRRRIVKVQPRRTDGPLEVLREPIEVATLEHGKRISAGTHVEQSRARSGGSRLARAVPLDLLGLLEGRLTHSISG